MNTIASHSPAETSPRSIARTAGIFWLMTILTSAFAFAAGGRFFVPGDAAATATNVIAHESLYRLAFCANVLLRPVNRHISLLAAFFSLIGCAIGAVSCLLFLAPVSILTGAQSAAGFSMPQLQAQALTFLSLSAQANDLGLVFFALHVLGVGYLIRRSTFLPSFLGVLLAITSLCYLTNSFATFLALPFRSYLLPFVGLGGLIGEDTLTFWLLIAGVNAPRWVKEAEASAECCSQPVPAT